MGGESSGQRLILAHGCFDLLHLGHIRHLQQARTFGERLIVSVTADRYVRKGPGRPRFVDKERAEALKALFCVDEVVITDAPDAVDTIKRLRPAVYIKGPDYVESADPVLTREREAVEACGGVLRFTSTRKWSSTELLASMSSLAPSPYHEYAVGLSAVQSDPPDAFERVVALGVDACTNGRRVFFVGNGGSAALASHMAADWQKAARVQALCFNEAASVTALANDVGYESVFTRPLRLFGQADDLLFAISSSGASPNIFNAVQAGLARGMGVITLSGFGESNPLRRLGAYNFYVPSSSYGVVETTHQAICHAILDRVIDALR